MAHGIYHHAHLEHNDILDFRKFWNIPSFRYETFKANYEFVWDIFNTVAEKNGIVLPRYWVAVDKLKKADRYRKYKDGSFVMEPLGPTIHIDMTYSLGGVLHSSAVRGSVAYSYNWYQIAEKFFMVSGSAKKALSDTHYIRHGFLCERWRAKSMREVYLTPRT